MPALPRVALLGLGTTGAPMAARLARAGVPLVVWNRSARPDLLPGVERARTPRDAAARAEVRRAVEAGLGARDLFVIEELYAQDEARSSAEPHDAPTARIGRERSRP